jgi:hypothetical protein
VYQFSFEEFLVFFNEENDDKRIVFSYENISIPYITKKVIIKGGNKFKKLFDFLHLRS